MDRASRFEEALWQGLFSQPRAGAIRISLQGYRVALMLDGQLLMTVPSRRGTR